ncbi:MAG: hypothetical protein Q4G16_09760, partial [Cruoricaptor ignavus]|nr:hypothetical protein [Cruoricaptor ignavus]
QEGIDYLIQAKYMEPYMRINYVETPDSFYYRSENPEKNATQLDFEKTTNALLSLYNATKNPEIKLRYAYQLVRFYHYTRNYNDAITAFKNLVKPLGLHSAPYYLALDQMAGAQRGLGQHDDANRNFFEVFRNLNTRKESAYTSMKLSDSASFQNLLKTATTNEEKNMIYFLLGYEDFNNPLQIMEKMYDINPNSEILKVLAARSINEVERNYLPTYLLSKTERQKYTNIYSEEKQEQPQSQNTEKENSFWNKIFNFFKSIFNENKNDTESIKNTKTTAKLNSKKLLNHPDRIPFYNSVRGYSDNDTKKDYLNDLERFTEKTISKSDDEFWSIANAYLKFLKKDYAESSKILSEIKTQNPEYIEQINRMKILNDIVAQPIIDRDFEEHIVSVYPDLFKEKEEPKTDEDYYFYAKPNTAEFIRDVLANRYFLQGEDAKSFLMNNRLSDLQSNPNSDLVRKVEAFYKKADKSAFEKDIIAKNIDMENPENFFHLIYGDAEMKAGNFAKAKKYYATIHQFKGIQRYYYDWEANESKESSYDKNAYNGFQNISLLVFGHNVWESYESSENESMKAENTTAFPFIKNKMNKLELSDALIQLQKIANSKNANAAKANQIIGNFLYNTSIIGYYRHLFVMDINNSNGEKFHFWNTQEDTPYNYYYKLFTNQTFIKPDNFDLAIGYYQKAFNQTQDKEIQSRILFQMASAEQGKFYQWEAKQPPIPYNDNLWYEKKQQREKDFAKMKNEKFRTYFSLLKSEYANTETTRELMGSCSYFDYFMKK